jgi:hypothetical protein
MDLELNHPWDESRLGFDGELKKRYLRERAKSYVETNIVMNETI